MTEVKEAGTAYSRMTAPDKQVIAAAVNMLLTVYAGLRISQLETSTLPKPSEDAPEQPSE